MHLIEGNIYHVYNRGNRGERIFFSDDNYLYFLKKVRQYLLPNCDMLAWCLMPNHFHFLVFANEASASIIKDDGFERQQFSEGLKMLLSSYTKAINKLQGCKGSLFQQKTKAKCVTEKEYALTAFHYIHQNPLRAKLVSKMEDLPYCSFVDYMGKRNGTICNKHIANLYLDVCNEFFYKEAYEVIDEDLIRGIR